MCRRVTCQTCEKPTWRGCGAHIEHVLGDVPADDRCACQAEPTNGSSLFTRVFGR
jgi:hypothetical protein